MEKETKPVPKKPTFADVKKHAANLAKRLEQLSQKSGSNTISYHAKRVAGVATALEVIGDTANASINAEGLEAFAGYVREAVVEVRKWFKELVNPDNDTDLDGYDDEIPF